jgi:transposase
MTLNELAVLVPDWLQGVMNPEWVKRYGRRFDGSRMPKSKAKRQELCEEIGEDGYFLLKSSIAPEAPKELAQSKMLVRLQKIWIQQYYRDGDGNTHWRTKKNYGQPPANLMISSPQDMDIHLAVKRETRWIGYKVHFTETCEKEHPRLITQVKTTNSCVHDVKMTAEIQDDLIARDLKPDIQLVD